MYQWKKTDSRFKEYSKRYAEIRMNLENTEYNDYYEKKWHNLNQLDDDSTDIWKEDWYEKYQKRPEELENVSLAQFVSKYTKNNNGFYVERKQPRIIRYRNYDMAQDYNEYRREMITLHLPFRNEHTDILADMKFITIYDENENTILERRKEFEPDIDIQKTIDICRQLCRQDEHLNDDEMNLENTEYNDYYEKKWHNLNQLDDDSTDIWKEDWYEKYQKRPEELENVSLAQFVSKYTKNNNGFYVERKQPRIIRYRNYDMAQDYNEYRREM
ncbi:hypothetical protein TSAR_006177, partial [Trichomalopsis sarcophagae]